MGGGLSPLTKYVREKGSMALPFSLYYSSSSNIFIISTAL